MRHFELRRGNLEIGTCFSEPASPWVAYSLLQIKPGVTGETVSLRRGTRDELGVVSLALGLLRTAYYSLVTCFN